MALSREKMNASLQKFHQDIPLLPKLYIINLEQVAYEG